MSYIVNGLKSIHKLEPIHVHDPTASKRCSVAIIIRFPELDSVSRDVKSLDEYLDIVAQNSTVRPEVLFIKRAVSQRDRWSSHIALPGGRRDKSDKNDVMAAVRESLEEVALDLDRDGIYVGPLDQRLVKVTWGSKSIMTLCPYIFILRDPSAEITCQPTEVATAFWYPMVDLFDPQYPSYEVVHIGERLGLSRYHLPKRITSIINFGVGDMLFGCIDLHAKNLLHDPKLSSGADIIPPFKLWGLTLGVMVDFLEMLKPGEALSLYKTPTFKYWDLRLMVSMLTYNYVSRKKYGIDQTLKANSNAHIGGTLDLVARILDGGYFAYLGRSIVLTFGIRAIVAAIVGFKLYKKFLK